MFRIILVILIVVPAVEIWGLISVGHWIGGWQTFGLILLTGFLGAFLVKKEAKKVWDYAQRQMSVGQIPSGAILDGICIFAGGLLLITPGFFTDLLGFLLVFPLSRPLFKRVIYRFIRKRMEQGNYFFFTRR